MKGYLVANITVTDPERYKRYKDAAPAVIGAFGGRDIVRGPDTETVEGGLPLGERFLILEFDGLQQARRVYFGPQDQQIAAHRKAGSWSDFHLMEGCLDPAEAFRPPPSGAVPDHRQPLRPHRGPAGDHRLHQGEGGRHRQPAAPARHRPRLLRP